MNRLHIDSITKYFGEKKILQDIYLGCNIGQIVGLLGRNGSGKSTLLKIIFGVLDSETQFIRDNGKILKSLANRKKLISYLPQEPFLPRKKKVKDLILLFCNKENAGVLLTLDLISPFLNEKPETLSVGEQRLIEALLIIYSEADFILLDEPFQSLSPKMVGELRKIISLQSKNKGFIISDHYYQDVLAISTFIYLLSNGHLKPIQDLKELQQYSYLPQSI
ncbi:ATP-binding cassette domain-containing protein [Chryseobacterium jejuense]|uniref:ABC-type lipopolysaccharide export system, ATPase component n=1 Tax=Chryseobacterium jejuense TaxID=445960 RepID=A0A2X2VIS9_CHRJE|nr:ATP-binding cassette domain-containing protein [Chryseobacterium jejuense]SDJ19332.1 ABC-type lipopolysaccharide export system, ATPase component [Chryseobacterium jejuense]SQB28284.1 Lipopolysaccharide export system ATP-binding protein LptB [Chryseobacterium jejuense]